MIDSLEKIVAEMERDVENASTYSWAGACRFYVDKLKALRASVADGYAVKMIMAEMRESVQNHLRAGEVVFAAELDDYIEGLRRIAAAPQPSPAEPVAVPVVTGTAPERIWLQVNADARPSQWDLDQPFPIDHDGITWADESIGGVEVEYVRVDLPSLWNAALTAAKAAQPESVEGDWYSNDDTGSVCVDLSPDPQRQIALICKRDGSVGYAVYAHGQSFHGSDANNEDFFTAITALTRPAESAAPRGIGLNHNHDGISELESGRGVANVKNGRKAV